MLDAVASMLTGGATGLLGSLFTGVFRYFEEKRKEEHEIAMRKLDMEEMDREWQYRNRMADREAATRLEESADSLMRSSYKNDVATYSRWHDIPPWGVIPLLVVDLVRGLVRPSLTVLLIAIVWSTREEVLGVLAATGVDGLSPSMALSIYQDVVQTILYCATTALLWWFGTRFTQRR